MVWLNTQCINKSVPKGTFGGAMCTCHKCREARYNEQQRREDRERCPHCNGTGKRPGV